MAAINVHKKIGEVRPCGIRDMRTNRPKKTRSSQYSTPLGGGGQSKN